MEWTITLKNTTGSVLFLSSLGWNMPVGTSANITDGEFFTEELVDALRGDLGTNIDSGDVVVNDGVSDLSAADGKEWINRASKKYIDDRDDTLVTDYEQADSDQQTEIDNIEEASGHNTDGTFSDHSGTNYMDAVDNAKSAREALDTQVKTNEDDIDTLETDLSDGLDTKLDLDGGNGPMTGNLNMGANEVFTTKAPSTGSALANRNFVMAQVQGVAPKASVKVATDAILPACTYNNGTAGVGATLTGNANGALADIDGVTLVATDELIVANQAAALQNGVYVVTTLGDGSNPFVLTRRVDFDGSPENEVLPGVSTPVQEGDTWSGFIFYLLGTSGVPRDIGTDTIDFDQVPGNSSSAGMQAEIDAIEVAVGLNSDGTIIQHSGSNYMDAALTTKAARELLDTQVKTNEDDIDTIETTIGDLKVVAGIIYGKDTTRAKWLGPREAYLFSRKGRVHNRYLKTGHVDSNKSSFRMDRAMTIVAMTIQLKEAETGATTFELRKNGTVTVIGSLVVTSAIGGQVTNLNIDLAAGETLEVYSNGVEVEEVVCKVTVAYNGGAVV